MGDDGALWVSPTCAETPAMLMTPSSTLRRPRMQFSSTSGCSMISLSIKCCTPSGGQRNQIRGDPVRTTFSSGHGITKPRQQGPQHDIEGMAPAVSTSGEHQR